jgi:phosphatidylglycerol---prolipoprotein diacylglyceryl transferase
MLGVEVSMLAYLRFPDWIQPEIIPGLPLRWYGFMYIASFTVAALLFRYQVRKRELDVSDDDILGFILAGIFGLLIGARLFATLLFNSDNYYLHHPQYIFWPFNEEGAFTGLQGMNYYGGVVGAIVGFALYCRIKKHPLVDWGDMLVAGIPLGYTFGRLGNFINAELYGRVTSAPWGMLFPHAKRLDPSKDWVRTIAEKTGAALTDTQGQTLTAVNLPRHPTQLYEAFFEGIVMGLIMWFFFRPRRKYQGQLVGIYILGYGLIRFFIDYVRMPLRGDFALKLTSFENPPDLYLSPFNFIASQFYSIAMVAGGLAFLFIARRRHYKRQEEKQERAKVRSKPKRRKLRQKLEKRK